MHRLLIEHLRSLISEGVSGLSFRPVPLVVDGEEARHALDVKRLRAGEAVQVFDGKGSVADAVVVEPPTGPHHAGQKAGKRREELCLEVGMIRHIPPILPSITVCSATPKGQRVDEMIEGLSQAGAAAWRPMRTERGVVDPREAKLERLGRISRESAKQCGRAWTMRIEPETALAEVLTEFPLVVVADAGGMSVMDEPVRAKLRSAGRVALLVGPEGGFTPAEFDQARQKDAQVVSFGPLIMRIETAAVIGAAMVIEAGRDRGA